MITTIRSTEAEVSPALSIVNVIDESVETLRRILAKEHCREISYNEAASIGESLIEFFEVLASAA